MTKPTKVIRAAIYARVSTEEQAQEGKTSLDEQIRLCHEEAKRRGWEVVGEYVDAGISGTDRNRPRWRALLAAGQNREIDAAIVLKLDRFARRAADILTETDRFIELGVAFVVVDQAIDMSTPAGRMMRTMLAGVAEMERDLIVGRTVAGQRAKALRGGRAGGEPPYGWKVDGPEKATYLVANDEERAVLTEAIHCLLRRHMNPQQIVDHLNSLGMRPRKAARWNPDVLRRMLTNPTLHTGKTWWGAKESGTFYKRSHHTRLDRDGEPLHGEPIEITLPGEPPLTLAQHRSIVRAIERRSTRGKSAEAKTQMLSTRLVGACGKHYIGVSISAKDYDVYRCSGRKHINGPDKCACKQVRADALDARVRSEIKGLFSSQVQLEGMARQWLNIRDDADVMDFGAIIAKLDQEVERKRRALTRAVDAQFDADDPDEHADRIARFRAELDDLIHRRDAHAALGAQEQDNAERVSDLVALADRARGRLEALPDDAWREIIEILDIRVAMVGDVVSRMPERVSEPERVRITGIIDPRLFSTSEPENRAGNAGALAGFAAAAKPSEGERGS